jgi:dTDP-4-dehydrorhamnose reductase
MKILLTGASGQVGKALQRSVPDGVQLLCPDRSELDLADAKNLRQRLKSFAADAVINAAAYTQVDSAETDRVSAQQINVTAVAVIAASCAEQNIPLIHLSTDFVFDGRSTTPYKPDASTKPLGTYAKTKRAGELAVLDSSADSVIIRTGWVYGIDGQNFVKTMLKLAATQDELTVVNDQIGTPTYALNLAGFIWEVLQQNPPDRILHFSDDGEASWYDFAVAIFSAAEPLQMIRKSPVVLPISASEFGAVAPRPAYSVLDKTQSIAALNIDLQDWREALSEMLVALKQTDAVELS